MAHEYIVETTSGSLYHLLYKKKFWKHGGRFTCRQLHAATIDFKRDDMVVYDFYQKDYQNRHDQLDLKDLKVGMRMYFGHTGGTSPIVKIFQLIH